MYGRVRGSAEVVDLLKAIDRSVEIDGPRFEL
jgi:hypothetical protein